MRFNDLEWIENQILTRDIERFAPKGDDLELTKEHIEKLNDIVANAVWQIQQACDMLECKDCIHHDPDGCALKVKEWNA